MIQTKDSGERQQFETGAMRDTQTSKPRFDLIPLELLDMLQQAYGGSPLEIDEALIHFTGWFTSADVRADLIPQIAINRIGALYARGALKYGEHNYQKGIPLERIYASLFRHLIEWRAGDTSEDHLAAIAWNAIALIFTENAIDAGSLPQSLATAGPLSKRGKS